MRVTFAENRRIKRLLHFIDTSATTAATSIYGIRDPTTYLNVYATLLTSNRRLAYELARHRARCGRHLPHFVFWGCAQPVTLIP